MNISVRHVTRRIVLNDDSNGGKQDIWWKQNFVLVNSFVLFFTSKYALVDVGLELQVEPIGHQVSSCFVHCVLPFLQHDEGTSDPFKRWK